MIDLNLTILWEDDDMMVVNKPPFVVVNRAESVKEATVADWAEKKLQIKSGKWKGENKEEITFLDRAGIAHRLDKETSGCLLIAKNPLALKLLLRQFHDRETKKEYLALVHGHLKPKEGTIRVPLSRSRYDREKWEMRYSGKMAQTTWKVLEYFADTSLVALFPQTGRTHQIRVHLAHLGYPIFADEKYLTARLVAPDREKLGHHFLHAAKIGFKDAGGVWRQVEAPLPPDASALLLLMKGE